MRSCVGSRIITLSFTMCSPEPRARLCRAVCSHKILINLKFDPRKHGLGCINFGIYPWLISTHRRKETSVNTGCKLAAKRL